MAAIGLLPVRWKWVHNVARPHAMIMGIEKRHYGGLLTVLLHTMGYMCTLPFIARAGSSHLHTEWSVLLICHCCPISQSARTVLSLFQVTTTKTIIACTKSRCSIPGSGCNMHTTKQRPGYMSISEETSQLAIHVTSSISQSYSWNCQGSPALSVCQAVHIAPANHRIVMSDDVITPAKEMHPHIIPEE